MSKIYGIPVTTPFNPEKLKPDSPLVKTVNGIAPDENGNVEVEGNNGADGFSPVATVTQTGSGAVISITDKSGTTTATVTNGKDGADGADGKDGYTPVKGVDYFTEVEVEEIAEIAAGLVDLPEGGETGIVWRGEWNEETAYNAGDAVFYNGSSYICEVDKMPTGEAPGAVDEWAILASKGEDGKMPVKGEDYFTEAEKQEIAEQAAGLVDVPTDAHINSLIDAKLGVIENGTY